MKGRQCDIWAAGVTLYNIASGILPFQGESRNDVKILLETKEVDYSMFEGKDMFVNLLKKMLNKDQFKRATVLQLERDPYLTKNGLEPLVLYMYDEEKNDIEDKSLPIPKNLKFQETKERNKSFKKLKMFGPSFSRPSQELPLAFDENAIAEESERSDRSTFYDKR